MVKPSLPSRRSEPPSVSPGLPNGVSDAPAYPGTPNGRVRTTGPRPPPCRCRVDALQVAFAASISVAIGCVTIVTTTYRRHHHAHGVLHHRPVLDLRVLATRQLLLLRRRPRHPFPRLVARL